jgi:hypothetical protein
MLIEAPPDDPTWLAVRDRLKCAPRGEDCAARWRVASGTVQRGSRIEQ